MAIYKSLVRKISVSPDMKTKQKEYLEQGNLAIVDQGQKLIGGYSDDDRKKVNCKLPVIVFGDHTRAVKLITFPFGAGVDGTKILEPSDDVYAKYLFYGTKYLVIKMPDKGYARHYQHLEKMDLPLPSFDEQKQIVYKIEELFSELDNAEATLRATKQQLAVYRQAVLKSVFSDIEKKETIRHVSSVVTSGSRGWSKYYSDHGAKFIRIGNLTRDRLYIDLSDIQYVDLPELAEGRRTRLQSNDVLVSITADLGSIGLVPEDIGEAYVNQHIAMIRFNNSNQGEFYAW